MEKKKSILLLISAILGCAYLIYSIVYWSGINSGSSSSAESIGFGIATAIVFPHLIATAVAFIFNLLGWIMNHKWFALTGAILYTVALLLFPLYFMFVIAEMILSYVGFARMSGREKQPQQARPQQPAPKITQNELGDLNSKQLVYADAMVRYCKHFGFDNGLTDAACKELFAEAERHVAPDTEVVMAFVARYPVESNVPCACAFAVHKLIIAARDNILELPTDQIKEISPAGDGSSEKLLIRCGEISYELGVDAAHAGSILDFLRRSKDACMADIKAEISEETKIKKYPLPSKIDGHPIQYAYIKDFEPQNGIDVTKDILDGEERIVEIHSSNENIELFWNGKIFGIIHDPQKAEMVSDWQRKGLPCHAILLSNGKQVNLRFYRDKRIGNEFREQTIVALSDYKSAAKQEVIEFLENGDELHLVENCDKDDAVDVIPRYDLDKIGSLPKEIAVKYLQEGAFGAFYERGDENDDGVIKPYIRIFW